MILIAVTSRNTNTNLRNSPTLLEILRIKCNLTFFPQTRNGGGSHR